MTTSFTSIFTNPVFKELIAEDTQQRFLNALDLEKFTGLMNLLESKKPPEINIVINFPPNETEKFSQLAETLIVATDNAITLWGGNRACFDAIKSFEQASLQLLEVVADAIQAGEDEAA